MALQTAFQTTGRVSRAAALAAVCGGTLLAGADAAHANVLGVTINDAGAGDYTITSVTVDRGPGGIFTYVPGQLIGVDLTDIAATGDSLVTQSGASVPAAGTRATMLEDGRLDTGLINPFSTGAAADASFGVTFLSPIVNAAGDDIVVFELGGGDPTAFWVNDDRTNARHDVVAADFSATLLSDMPFTQYAYANPGGGTNVDGLAALESTTGWGGAGAAGQLGVVAVGLDLTDFGIADGASITSLRWQTTSTGSRLDAVYVAGLIPEPASLVLLGASGLCLLTRRGS